MKIEHVEMFAYRMSFKNTKECENVLLVQNPDTDTAITNKGITTNIMITAFIIPVHCCTCISIQKM